MAGEERTEEATPQKLREARKRGDVPTSPEISAAVLGVVGVVALQQQGSHIVEGLMNLLTADLASSGHASQLTQNSMLAQLRSDAASGMLLLLPFAFTIVVAGLVIGAANTRGLLSLHGITPSFRKLNPLTNAKNIFGKEGLVLLLKAVLKVGIVVMVLRAWQGQWEQMLPQLPFMEVGPATGSIWSGIVQAVLQIAFGFFLVGIADFFYRYRAWRKRMRMTKQEVKEEYKRMEGNPQMRARMRQTARRRLREIMSGGLRAVPQADVVITNPTHFAVAIQYQAGKMRAPKVVAKGQRLFAQRIKEIARKHNIPIVENKPLAQALYKSVKPGQEIPAELYQAVAQVLAFVYRLRGLARVPSRPLAAPQSSRS